MTQSITLKFATLAFAAFALAACGRAGSPERPPSAPQQVDQNGDEQQVEDRPFILDGLLN